MSEIFEAAVASDNFSNPVSSALNRDERERIFIIGKLFNEGVIYENDDIGLWSSINRRKDIVQADLNRVGVYLKIVDSGKSHYACVINNMPNMEHFPRIISKKKLGKYESFIASLLRMAYVDFEHNAEERCVITASKIFDELIACKRINDEQIFYKKIQRIMAKFKTLGIVRPVGSDEKEYEIRGVIKEVVTVSELDQYLKSLKKVLNENTDLSDDIEEDM